MAKKTIEDYEVEISQLNEELIDYESKMDKLYAKRQIATEKIFELRKKQKKGPIVRYGTKNKKSVGVKIKKSPTVLIQHPNEDKPSIIKKSQLDKFIKAGYKEVKE